MANEYQRLPYVRPAYEPGSTMTVLDLMRLASAAQSRGAATRGAIAADTYRTIGDLFVGTIDRAQAERERRRLEGIEAQRYQDAQAAQRQQFGAMESERAADRADRSLMRQRQSALDAIGATPAGPIGPQSAAAIREYGPTSGLVRDQQTLPARVTPGAFGDVAADPQSFAVRDQTPEELERAQAVGFQRSQAEAAAAVRAADDARMRQQLDETIRHNKALERATTVRSGPRPMTDGQRVQLTNQLVRQWTTANKPYQDVRRQVAMMDAGMAAARRGDIAAGNEAVLQTFMKVLDPNSVVREGEFWRLMQGQSLLKRVESAVQRVHSGGWVPIGELEKYAKLAREVETAVARHSDGTRKRIQRTADEYEIAPELIFDSEPLPDDGSAGGMGAPEAGPAPGGMAPIRPSVSHNDPLTVTAPNGMVFRFQTPGAAAGFRARAGLGGGR